MPDLPITVAVVDTEAGALVKLGSDCIVNLLRPDDAQALHHQLGEAIRRARDVDESKIVDQLQGRLFGGGCG